MSEINSIANGSFVLGQTSATNFIAGNGITIDSPSAGTVRIGTDETVLWSQESQGTATSGVLSEPASAFGTIVFEIDKNEQGAKRIEVSPLTTPLTFCYGNGVGNAYITWLYLTFAADYKSFNVQKSKTMSVAFDSTATGWAANINTKKNVIDKVIGINRISGGNA